MATRRTPLAADKKEGSRRVRLDDVGEEEVMPSYFTSGSDKTNLSWTSSGCTIFDEALGGGYALGRVVNIVGDKSTGKTLLAMEACANFARDYPNGFIRYAETEAAFDPEYADALGIPIDRIQLNKNGEIIGTVERLYEDMKATLDENKDRPGIYIVDSLDAISDEAEQERKFEEGSYGGTKPKQIGKMFRMLVERLNQQRVLLIIISQLRDKIGVTFGETKTRSGGKALDFYATHIVWLADLGKEKRTVKGIERVVGVNVRARVKKNKVGLAHREVDYPILFGYGIDDLTAGCDWLVENKRGDRLEDLDLSVKGYKVAIRSIVNKGGEAAKDLRDKMRAVIREEWRNIESEFIPKARKY